jgi:hypothetical protein
MPFFKSQIQEFAISHRDLIKTNSHNCVYIAGVLEGTVEHHTQVRFFVSGNFETNLNEVLDHTFYICMSPEILRKMEELNLEIQPIIKKLDPNLVINLSECLAYFRLEDKAKHGRVHTGDILNEFQNIRGQLLSLSQKLEKLLDS